MTRFHYNNFSRFAPTGCKFDNDDEMYLRSDAVRYACWIQEARDAGDYARADEVREMAVGFGCEVMSSKKGTAVLDINKHNLRVVRVPLKRPVGA